MNEDTTNGCPFESISKEIPFEIDDETEIIYLRSKYNESKPRTQPCLWKFKTTIQYGFKIVVQHFTISSTTKFQVKNSTRIILG